MSNWSRDFKYGWRSMLKEQRFHRARYVVEQGIRRGHNISEVARTIDVNLQTVQDLVDLYAIGMAINEMSEDGGGTGRPVPVDAGEKRTREAIKQFGTKPTQQEVEAVAEEYGMSGDQEGLATRIARGRNAAENLIDAGRVDYYSGDGSFGLNVPDPRGPDAAKAAKALQSRTTSNALTPQQWQDQFRMYASKARAFLAFLRRTNQDRLTDAGFCRQLEEIADGFQEQHSRFETGVAKAAARR